MERYYKRAADIDQKIHSVKLPYLAWKVLFLIGEKQSFDDLMKILEEEQSAIDGALSVLLAEGLIEGWEDSEKEEAAEEQGEEKVAEEAVPAEEITEQEEPTEAAEEILEEETVEHTEEPEKAESEATEEEIEEVLEEPVSEIIGEAGGEETLAEETEEKEIDEADFFAEEPDIVIGQEKGEAEKAEEALEEKEESVFDTESALDEGTVFDEVETSETTEVHAEEEKETIDLTESEVQEESVSLDLDFEGEKEKEETEPAPAEEIPEEKKPARSTDEKIILVIDDSIVIRKMVELALENEDYQIETAVTGKDGLKLLDQLEPNIVILDLMLPDINGIDLLKTIKASKGIPVIMLSGKDSPQTIEKARAEGADAFLPKPFRDEELVQTIKKLI